MVRETGKQRSQRIQIDYYRQGGGLQKLRTACIVAGLVAAGLYAAYVLASGGGSHTSTGPVARAHAAFENDCSVCHKDFVPIDSQAVKIDLKWAGIDSKASIEHLESTCQSCHHVGDHYRELMNESGAITDQNCGLCHAEHKGREHDLTLIANRQCVQCHQGLSNVCTGAPTINANVTAFTAEAHGDFASLTKPDTGKIMFDHAQHMMHGQVNAGEKGAFLISMLPESLRDRYRQQGQSDDSPVRLDCQSCHAFDGNPAGVDSLSFDSELGRYMAPVSFEQHCVACHAISPGVATPDAATLPHAAPWKQIDLLLAGTVRGARRQGQARVPRDDRQAVPQPGEGTGQAASDANIDSSIDLASLRDLVRTQCLKCHDQESITDQAIAQAPHADPMIPPRWFEHGLYDHGAHRDISCKYCHAEAYGDPTNATPQPPNDHEKVMIAGIETCTGCHRDADTPTPQSIVSAKADGLMNPDQTDWASDSCIYCHRYHTRRDRGEAALSIQSATEAGQ